MKKKPAVAANGFATKTDLKRLEGAMNVRFTVVDKRFEQVDRRFEQVDKRFVEVEDQIRMVREGIRMDFEFFKEDLTHHFTNEWQKKIDPFLVEIVKHRENEALWAEQNARADERIILFQERLDEINQWVEERKKQEPVIAEQSRLTQILLEKIAKKVGV